MKKKMELRRLYLNRQQYINASEDIKKEKKNILKTVVFRMMQMYMEEVTSVKCDLLAVLKKMLCVYKAGVYKDSLYLPLSFAVNLKLL